MKKTTCFIIALTSIFGARVANAQMNLPNMPEHDSKPYYFGLTFGTNMSTYKITHSQTFALTDTFNQVQAKYSAGFNLGIMGNLRLTKFIDVRFIPAIVFTEKSFTSTSGQGNKALDTTRSLEGILMNLPFQFKFKSDRINNFRFYAITGGYFNYDLASNARSRKTDEWLRTSASDFGVEVGFGLEFFYPNFIFAPEIKISQGFKNMRYPDSQIQMSNAIDKLTSRMITFSIHLEG